MLPFVAKNLLFVQNLSQFYVKMDNVSLIQVNVKLLKICSVLKIHHSNVLLESVSNNQTYVFQNLLETEMLLSLKLSTQPILHSLTLDVLLINLSDVLMVLAERDTAIAQFSLVVTISDYNSDVNLEDVLLMLLNVLPMIKISRHVLII